MHLNHPCFVKLSYRMSKFFMALLLFCFFDIHGFLFLIFGVFIDRMRGVEPPTSPLTQSIPMTNNSPSYTNFPSMKRLLCVLALFPLASVTILCQGDTNIYVLRRSLLLKNLHGSGTIAFINPPDLSVITEKPYRYYPESNMFYLTGITVPDAILILSAKPLALPPDTFSEFLIMPYISQHDIIWQGLIWDTLSIVSKSGVRHVFTTADTSLLWHVFSSIDSTAVFSSKYPWIQRSSKILERIFDTLASKEKTHFKKDVERILTIMRQRKSQDELNNMIMAARITCDAIMSLLPMLKYGASEKYIANLFIGNLYLNSAEPCFNPIVAGGNNTLTLHHTPSDYLFKDSDLVLIDVGASWNGYCIDMTRTLPISERFTPQQDTIYRIVYKASRAAISSIRPGVSFWEPHRIAVKTLQEELLKLGIIKKPSDIHKLIPHGVIHSIGIDVHEWSGTDVFLGGEVIAVEPGLYIRPDTSISPRWWNIGIRIEETVLVTETGAEIITDCLPAAPDDVQNLIPRRPRD